MLSFRGSCFRLCGHCADEFDLLRRDVNFRQVKLRIEWYGLIFFHKIALRMVEIEDSFYVHSRCVWVDLRHTFQTLLRKVGLEVKILHAAAVEAAQFIVEQVQLHRSGADDKVTHHAAVEQFMLGRILKAYQLSNVDGLLRHFWFLGGDQRRLTRVLIVVDYLDFMPEHCAARARLSLTVVVVFVDYRA